MSIRATVIAAFIALIAALSFGVYYYHDAYSKADHDLTLAKETIADMQTRQRDVAAGRKRLRISATCNTSTPSGVDASEPPRITPDAERDYFRLRAGIETITKQLTGLQEYVREQCLK